MKFANRMNSIKPSAIREVGKKIAAKENCLSFAAGLPSSDLFPLEDLIKATDYVIRNQGKTALQYGPTKGHNPLLDKLVEIMKKKGVDATREMIQITTGSQQAISCCCMAFVDPGDVIITENPSYLGALAAFRAYECAFAGVEADDDGMLPEDLEKVLKDNPRAKMIYIVPNFSNPTGRTWSLERRKAVYELACKYDLPIIEDNPYGDIRFEGEPVPDMINLDTEGRVIYLGSFSKVLCPGLRVGWIYASPEVAYKFEILKQGIDLQSTQFGQMQICEYLTSCDLDSHIKIITAAYKSKRDLMMDCVKKYLPESVKYTNPAGGMFIWFELPENIDAYDILDKALEQNVGFVPGGPFFPETERKNTMRLNFTTMSDENINKGMKILGSVISKAIKE